MKLSDYLSGKEISAASFAETLGVERQTVHRWVRGERYPDFKMLVRIAEATGGAVTPNDFFGVGLTDPEEGRVA